MAKVKCVKTKKEDAEETRKKLDRKNLLNRDYKTTKDEENVYFPVKKETERFKTIKKEVEEEKKKPRSIEEYLKEKLTNEELNNLTKSFDIIGDIAVIEIPDELEHREDEIGRSLLKIHPSVSTVCKRASKTQGKFRIRPVEPIAGEKKTQTTHKEHGVKIKVDLNKMYFNPRLSHEREVIARKTKPNEHIGYLFAGAGPFALVITHYNPEVKTTAIELNPDAYRYLKKNIELNGFQKHIKSVKKDVKDIEGYSFDRVLMPLPLKSKDFLDNVVKNTSENAIVHYYSLGEKPNYFQKPIKEIQDKVEKHRIIDKREVLNYSPGKKEVAIDFQIRC